MTNAESLVHLNYFPFYARPRRVAIFFRVTNDRTQRSLTRQRQKLRNRQ